MLNICLLSDQPPIDRTLLKILRDSGSVSFINVADEKAPYIGKHDVLVVVLKKLNSIKWLHTLRRARNRQEKPPSIVVLADGPELASKCQVSEPGIDLVFDGRQPVSELSELLEDLKRTRSSAERSIARQAITEAGNSLTRLFEAVEEERTIDQVALARASEGIDEALSDSSLRSWIDEAVRHHMPTVRHVLLVAGITSSLSRAMGIEQTERFRLVKGALLHDVGKLKIPTAILDKEGPLSEQEATVLRTHAALGESLVRTSFPQDETLCAIVRSHHEKLDGSGYPDGLVGDSIPLAVRIVTVADMFAALLERRSYKVPIRRNVAYAILAGNAGAIDLAIVRNLRHLA